MPFVVVSGVGRGMGVLDGGGDRRKGKGQFWVNLGRPIVTNMETLLRSCARATHFKITLRGRGLVCCIRNDTGSVSRPIGVVLVQLLLATE